MRRIIVGTAGHIDHGKSALVQALTGIDPDRLPVEKARGITTDLGFASLQTEDERLGFVDVPGHEKFVRHMIAGAGGIDVLLLVVAADEGVKPQTREHLAVARLLGLSAGVVALTKADRASADLLTAAEQEVHELVRGTFLDGAPMLAVSAKTGRGIDELKAALVSLARSREERSAQRPLRLPVDRVFSIAGFGPVATGSLVSGSIAPDQTVELAPEGKLARARRVEVHGRETRKAIAGERTSVNLAGVELADLHRGQMIVEPGAIVPTARLLASVELLEGGPGLSSGDTALFLHFASETSARIRVIGTQTLKAGQRGAALLSLQEPVAAVVGDRYILRRPSPAATLGGGEILDCHPPRKIAAADLSAFFPGAVTPRLVRRIEREPAGISLANLAREEFLTPEEVADHLAPCVASKEILELPPGPSYLMKSKYQELAASAADLLRRELAGKPGSRGIRRAEIVERVFLRFEPKTAEGLLRRMATDGLLELAGDEVRLPGKAPLPAAEQTLVESIARRYDESGLNPPSPAQVAASLNAKPQIVEGLIQFLVKEKRLARLPGGFLIAASTVDKVAERLRASGKKTITVPEFKELFSLTRRLAIPLLEHLDERKITRRAGETREVL